MTLVPMVEVIISGGMVESVRAPRGCTVAVYDYDVEGLHHPMRTDGNGDRFIAKFYEGQGDYDVDVPVIE